MLSIIEELKKQVIEGEDTTAPCCSGNCEDKAGQLLKLSLPADLEEKTADLKQDRSNARRSDMNQCRNTTMDDMADLEESPYDTELPCSCGQCSSAESTNEEIEAMGRRTKSIRDSNSELEN